MDRIAKAKPLFDLIIRHESASAVKPQCVESPFDVVWGGIRKEDRPKKLSAMTVGKVLWWQDLIDSRYMSEAAGAFQIMEDTLRTLSFDPSEIFNEACQKRLALQLLDRRGWARCEAREITPESFGNNLAKEWASLPVLTGPKKGRSYYAGDGLNKAHAGVDEVLEAISAALVTTTESEPSLEDEIVAWIQAAPPQMRPVAEWLLKNPMEKAS